MNILNSSKTYEVGNLGATPTNIFVGKTHISSNEKLPINNNQSVFLFASLTAGKNVRIDQATEKEPQIFIDTKFYDFKPYGYLVNYSANKDLKLLESAFNSPGVNLRTIIDSIGDYQGDSVINFKAISSSRGIVIEEVNNELILKSALYDLQNKSNGIKLFTGRSKDANGNYEFNVNRLIEGNCIKFKQILEFAWYDNSSSSDSSSSDSSSSYLIKSSSSSSSSDSSDSSKLSSSSNSSSSDSSQSLDCCALSKIKGFNFEFDFDISSNSFSSYSSISSNSSPSSNSSGSSPSSISSLSSDSSPGQIGLTKSYIGFTAGTGGSWEEHWIYDFSFTSSFDSINFSNYKSSCNFINNASLVSNSIRLTQSGYSLTGQTYYLPGVSFVDSNGNLIDWSCSFTMGIGIYTSVLPADGIVFVLQSQSDTAGEGGGGIGYQGISNSVGIEFDTWYNGIFNDTSVPHIGINLNGNIQSVQQVVSPVDFRGSSSTIKTSYVWVDYISGVLSVFISGTNSKPGSPAISRSIDLRTYLQI